MQKTLLIIGAGGHARVIADSATESGEWDLINLYDDAWPELKTSGTWSITGTIHNLLEQKPENTSQVIIAIGSNQRRYTLQERFSEAGWKITKVIHPSATISQHTHIGVGTVVMAGVVINSGTNIGNACIINTCTSVDHDCLLGNAVHLSPGTTLAGTVTVGDGCWIGVGSSVINNIHIGKNTVIGAGATVIRNIPKNVLAVGTPTQIIKNL
ncbi:acetyltransferase [Granulosicoccus antarcticus]|uniref:Acetyltransferase EpsM n=1 Tax=Granulosicoccus antarcticus IMCC3135 TaxID=1192854 RepID=A0A2Z2P0D1_9GAMM|nr:acetyltransferase [Granulosicoccus antarcticus]ASJ74590.1 Putative acetyltransferase EpsM [Granulosicoccus antarcticus IMCC3135]